MVALEGSRAVLVVENVPAVPEDKIYQVWVIQRISVCLTHNE